MIRSRVRSVIHEARITHAGGPSLGVDAYVLRAAETLDHKPRVARRGSENKVLSVR